MNRSRLLVALLCTVALLLTSCGLVPGSAAPTAAPAPTAVPAPTAAPSPEPAPTAVPTDAPAPEPTIVPGSDTGSGIYYIDPGGETIMRVQPDGSGMEEAFTGLNHILGGPLTYLGPIAAHPMQVMIAGAGTHYAAISGGVSIDMGAFAAPPRWSADGWRAVGALPTDTGLAGTIAMFDLRSQQRSELPISGRPDWFPDGQRLVYVRCGPEDVEKGCNVWTYDLASGASAQISRLVSTVDDRWYVQEAHVLPDGNTVIFYGNHTTEVGASGNGLQWWAIPASGGDAQLFSESYGNGVNEFQLSPDGAQLAYITRAHVSACASSGDLLVRDSSPAGDPARGAHPALPGADEANERYAMAQGLSWDPAGSAQIVFGSQSYRCTDNGREMDPAAIYLWDSAAPGAAPRMLAEGTFPVWIP